MSIKNLRLNPLTINNLYEKDLVVLNYKAAAQKTEGKLFLGNNRKKIAILVDNADAIHIKETNLEVLTKMLTACKLSLEDVAIINRNNKTIQWGNIKEILPAETILLFGVEPTAFGMPILFPEYHIQKYDNTIFLTAASLDEISGNQLLKSKLWICLKTLFLS